MPLSHVLWYLDNYLVDCVNNDAVVVVDETPAMAAKIAMSDRRTKVAFLAVAAIKQNDLSNAVRCALQHAIVMRYMLEDDQVEQRVTGAPWATQEDWPLRGIQFWVSDRSRRDDGHQNLHAAEAAQEQIVSEAPVDDSEYAPKYAPTLPKLKKTAQVVPTRPLQQEKEPPQVARSGQKKKERNRTRRKKQTMRTATKRRRKRIWIKYWIPSRSGSGSPPLTSMQVPPMRVRTSQRR